MGAMLSPDGAKRVSNALLEMARGGPAGTPRGGLFCSRRVGNMDNYTTTIEGLYMATESGMSPR